MVETRIDELDRMHRDSKQPREHSVRGKVRTESISSQQAATKWEGITTTLKVDIACASQFCDFTPTSLEPARSVDRFGLPLRMAKSAQHQALTINEARVRNEDHIGQLFHRLDHFDFCPGSTQVGHQIVPLFNGKLEIRTDFLMHPGIDLIEYPEVIGRAHEIRFAP